MESEINFYRTVHVEKKAELLDTCHRILCLKFGCDLT